MKYQTKCIKIGVGIRLMKVVDNATTGKSHGFDNGTSGTSNDYTYDANGNMISDNNKGITSITYNHLNLPQLIVFDNYNSIEYIYNAAGQKIKKMVIDETTNPVTHKAVDYLDGFQYAGEYLQFFPHGEGYVSVTTAGMSLDGSPNAYYYNYVYNYTDHLGNIRLSYTKDPSTNQLKILEENNYYPFGLKHTVYNSGKMDYKTDPGNGMDPEPGLPPVLENVRTTKYNYKYNGKEFQDELNLNLYDYGFRNYDLTLGRWYNLDPHSETYYEWSPYHYSANNPVFFVDVDGRDWFVNNENGNVIYLKGVNDLSKMGEEKIKEHNLGDISKYENFGADDMFGDSVKWGDLGDLLQYDGVSMNGDSEMFMYLQGYYKAEKVDIVESKSTEFSTDRSKHTSVEYLQDGEVKMSYASLSAFGNREKTKDPTIDYYPFSNVTKQYHEYTVKPGEGKTLSDRLNDDKSSFSSPRIKGGTASYKELLKEVIKLFKK